MHFIVKPITSSNAIRRDIQRYIYRGKLHHHDENGARHDTIYAYENKSFVLTDSNENHILELLRHPSWFTWDRVPSTFDGHIEFRLTVKYNELTPFLLWFYSPRGTDDENDEQLIKTSSVQDENTQYYSTNVLAFRYYPRKKKWRILPEYSGQMMVMSDEFHDTINLWRGKKECGKSDGFNSGFILGLKMFQRVLFRPGRNIHELARNLCRDIEKFLEKAIKQNLVPSIPANLHLDCLKKCFKQSKKRSKNGKCPIRR